MGRGKLCKGSDDVGRDELDKLHLILKGIMLILRTVSSGLLVILKVAE